MTLEPQRSAQLYLTATWLLALAILALWFPLSGRMETEASGTRVVQVSVGLFQPLQFTWESAVEWSRFRVSEVRWFWLVLTAVLTLAAQAAAQWTWRKSRPHQSR